ncbi:cysteine/glutathione ABC transporter ATP-binding protein/permease CydC [Shewanella sp. NFH-SH190041]|uniref:heme ABC transporter ATP-binding protein/permease CydC n=1 Tax=Shewanella sp. NFH-SH190041 TaxID=2950245 RepID=UPI0021C25D97|nr:cysteine/glutathione ABC transporter ATP-binding protein/permease CydC [Shewanella sp. NFH-SH190041]BDM65588.1 cysteine/glutathione ABC transporter ATP-binding protein/permease CydC [Shewanella sp. NFH-SH190041]
MRVLLPFIRLFSRQWLMMLVGIVLSIVTLIAGFGLLSLSGWFLSATAVAGVTLVSAQAFNFFTPAGGVRFLSITRTASRYGERLATHEATFQLLTSLRIWVWRRLMPLSEKDLAGVRYGDLLNRLVADIDTLDHLYLRLLTPLLASLVMTGILYLFLAWFDPQLARVLCSVLLLACFMLPAVFYWLGKQPGRAVLVQRRRFRIQLLEYLQGQGELTLFNARGRYRDALEQVNKAFLQAQQSMATITALSQAALVLVSGAALLLMLVLAASGVGSNTPPGPMYALVVFAALACVEMLMPLAGSFQHLSACVMAAERVSDVTDRQPGIVFPVTSTGDIRTGALSVTGLSFAYQAGQQVLSQLDLNVPAGKKVALLGQTGSGKSSLLKLITRQWQADSGSICIDGREIDSYSQEALRRGIAVVSQRVYLFAGTLRDNLTLALPADDVDMNWSQMTLAQRKAARTRLDMRLSAVLQQVGLETLLQGDKPLDTWLGDGGRQLSGGEQRRIGIARVLLHDAPLLLLDEPTEGLDKRTERDMLNLLFEFAKDRTLLMISHRLTAMAQMDEIHLLEQGRISASGTHTELLAKNTAYQSLYQRLNISQ